MKKGRMIVVVLLILILLVEGYMMYQILFNNASCVMNPANFMYKQLNNENYSCGCYPNSAIQRNINIDFKRQ